MTTPRDTKKLPVHSMAWVAFAGSIVAVVFAFYGSLHAEKHLPDSPLRQARGSAGLPAQPTHWYERVLARGETSLFGDRADRAILALTTRSNAAYYAVHIIAYVFPFLLGIGSALLGGWAMSLIEGKKATHGGDLQAVFSMMIGSFAAIIAGCMMMSLYVWKWVPAGYN